VFAHLTKAVDARAFGSTITGIVVAVVAAQRQCEGRRREQVVRRHGSPGKCWIAKLFDWLKGRLTSPEISVKKNVRRFFFEPQRSRDL
jgi:hypothetical protein